MNKPTAADYAAYAANEATRETGELRTRLAALERRVEELERLVGVPEPLNE